MQKEIVEKLNLEKTNVQIGQTFKYGIPVYQYKEIVYLAECDTTGEPQGNGYILVSRKDFRAYKYFSPEFLLDIPIEEFDKIAISFPYKSIK